MKSTRTALTLGYVANDSVEDGVDEDKLEETKVKAEQLYMSNRRREVAMAEGVPITARFSVRSNLVKGNLKYALWKGSKYKVNNSFPNAEDHFTVIELGELI